MNLDKEISELHSKAEQIPCESERAQIKLVIHSCRVLLAENDFLTADEILHLAALRIDYLLSN